MFGTAINCRSRSAIIEVKLPVIPSGKIVWEKSILEQLVSRVRRKIYGMKESDARESKNYYHNLISWPFREEKTNKLLPVVYAVFTLHEWSFVFLSIGSMSKI